MNRQLYIGLHPSKTENETDPGHVWLVLIDGEHDGKKLVEYMDDCYRGYYPIVMSIPDEFKKYPNNPLKDFFMYFLKNPVPGQIIIDTYALHRSKRFGGKFYKIANEKEGKNLDFAWKESHIPDGEDSIKKGFYGLNIAIPDVNNCVSWSTRVVNACIENKEEKIPLTPRVKSIYKHLDSKYEKYS